MKKDIAQIVSKYKRKGFMIAITSMQVKKDANNLMSP